MTNNTTTPNNTTNQTVDSAGDGLIDSILDLGSSNELIIVGVIALGLGTYAYLKVPAVRQPVMMAIAKLTDKHGEEIEALIKEHLGAKFDKMEYEVKKKVKNEVLQDVILASFDHTEKKAAGAVGKIVKDIAKDK